MLAARALKAAWISAPDHSRGQAFRGKDRTFCAFVLFVALDTRPRWTSKAGRARKPQTIPPAYHQQLTFLLGGVQETPKIVEAGRLYRCPPQLLEPLHIADGLNAAG